MNIFSKQLPIMNFFSINIIFHFIVHYLCLLYYFNNHNLKASFMSFLKIYFWLKINLFEVIKDFMFLIFCSLHLVIYFHKLFLNSVIFNLLKFIIFLIQLIFKNIYIIIIFNYFRIYFHDLKYYNHFRYLIL